MVTLGIMLAIAVYSFVLFAVLLRPASTTKMIFGILLAIAVVWIGFLVLAGYHTSLPGTLLAQWSGPPLTAVIAFLCVLKLKYNQVA